MKFSKLVLTIKKYMKNPKIANDKAINLLINPIVISGNILDEEGLEYEVSKQRASSIINNKEDIPRILRDALSIYNIENDVAEIFEDFIEDQIQIQHIDSLIDELSSLISESKMLTEDGKRNILSCKTNNPKFISKILLYSLSVNNKIEDHEKTFFKKGNNEASIVKGDLFEYGKRKGKRIIVIPVETTFETSISWKYENTNKPLISSETLHGMWIIRMNQSGVSSMELRKRIDNYFKDTRTSDNENNRHKIGTISVIEHGEVVYYLLAISNFDENNRSISTKEDIEKSINSLLSFYDSYGQGLPLYMPLIGTGRSRAGLDYDESLRMIVNLINANAHLVQGKINIVIKKDVNIDI